MAIPFTSVAGNRIAIVTDFIGFYPGVTATFAGQTGSHTIIGCAGGITGFGATVVVRLVAVVAFLIGVDGAVTTLGTRSTTRGTEPVGFDLTTVITASITALRRVFSTVANFR
jgi:hypothetical protein